MITDSDKDYYPLIKPFENYFILGKRLELVDYEIKNLWEDYIREKILSGGILGELEIISFILLDDPIIIWVRLNASISNDDVLKKVSCILAQYEPFTVKYSYEMQQVEDNIYSTEFSASKSIEKMIKFLVERKFGIDLWFITTPDFYWESVNLEDISKHNYNFSINERLPTIDDALQDSFIPMNNYYIAVWYAPFGSDRIDVLITDPADRKTGTTILDGKSQIINEIPDSILLPDVEIIESQMMLGLAIVPDPLMGEYTFTIYGKESANYTLQTVWWDNGTLMSKSIINNSIEEGEIKTVELIIGSSVNPKPIPEFTPVGLLVVIGALLIVIKFNRKR